MKTRKLVTIASLLSIAIVLSIVESYIPYFVPGVKIGFANIITLIVMYLYSSKEGAILHFLRIFLVGLIFSGLFSQSFLLSLAGGTLSFLLMWMLYITKKTSIISVSVIGSVGHSIGQLVLSMVLLKTTELFLYLPLMLMLSIPAGILTSLIAKLVLKHFQIDTPKTKLIGYIEFGAVFLLSLTGFILLSLDYKKSDEASIATITYQNEEIIKISLNSPDNYKLINNGINVFKEYEEVDNSYLYTFNFYNKDDKKYHDFIVEVKDNKIRVKEEVSIKHICMHMGFIDSKYQSLVCVPNNVVIRIDNPKLADIDAIM